MIVITRRVTGGSCDRPRHRAFGDDAHHEAALEGDCIAGDGEAHAVLIGPGGPDGRPAGVLAFANDAVDAVGRLATGIAGGGHDDAPLVMIRETISRLHGEPRARRLEPLVTPRAPARPQGMELHKPTARKRMGLIGGGAVPARSPFRSRDVPEHTAQGSFRKHPAVRSRRE